MAHIKQGSKGGDVKKLQTQLNKTKIAGPKLKVDGIFGEKTLAGVRMFQKNEKTSKLKADGVVGPKTKAALDAYVDPKVKAAKKEMVKKGIELKSSLARYSKQLEKLQKFLGVIQAQKKKATPVTKEMAQLKKEVKNLEYLIEQASSAGGSWQEAAAAGMAIRNMQIDLYNINIDLNELKGMRSENQSDFDRRIKDAIKRIGDTKKKVKKLDGDIAKVQKAMPK